MSHSDELRGIEKDVAAAGWNKGFVGSGIRYTVKYNTLT